MEKDRPVRPLTVEEIEFIVPWEFPFETTEELAPLDEIMGQERAKEALTLGISLQRLDYNIFALGPSGVGKKHAIKFFLEKLKDGQESPPDICYVNNFRDPQRPKLLQLPAGYGIQLREDMKQLIEDVGSSLISAFTNEEFQMRRQMLAEKHKQQREKLFEELQKKAKEFNFALIQTPMGLTFVPLKEGELMSPQEFKSLPEEEQKALEEKEKELQKDLQKIIRQLPKWEREKRQEERALQREVADFTVSPLIGELQQKYSHLPEVVEYLEAVREDIVENHREFLEGEEKEKEFRRYRVNVLIDRTGQTGKPVIYEDHPTYQNLFGRIEKIAQFGTLLTDFTMLRAGALHRANGGYLLLDAQALLSNPFAWSALKRALISKQIKIESVEHQWGLTSTTTLEPEPVPLDLKVILMGSSQLYYLLLFYDPDFQRLFKVSADFESHYPLTRENSLLYARLIADIAAREKLRPLTARAVKKVFFYSSRWSEDRERLSARIEKLKELLIEADYWAQKRGGQLIDEGDIKSAVEAYTFRNDRIRSEIEEQILRDTLLIETSGQKVGQVNGLSVISLGRFEFGRPQRISASVWPGRSGVIDIEREVKLGGPIHSKGVLILSSFLYSRYGQKFPLSLSARIVFEQSYGQIEGDSASAAELCAILSAIAGVPLRQNIAITGSVDQMGRVQPVGGVNAKIEGFFRICKKRGMTEGCGVIIPKANLRNFHPDDELLSAVREGAFRIYAVDNIDQAIEILTGLPAGTPSKRGSFPKKSFNYRVENSLKKFLNVFKKSTQKKEKNADGKEKGEK